MNTQNALHSLLSYIDRQEGWHEWQPHVGSWLGTRLPSVGGLLAIRMEGDEVWTFISETGNIKERVGALQNIYNKDKRPGGTPHTASPHLWERLRAFPGRAYEVSYIPLPQVTDAWRKALAHIAIARHRATHRCSPYANFGLMLGDKSLPPVVDDLYREDPLQVLWGRLVWSPWQSISALKGCTSAGLYRLRMGDELLFFGHGKIWERVRLYKDSAMQCSYVCDQQWSRRDRLELLNDCIAMMVLATETLPVAQFSSAQEKEKFRHV